MAVDFGGEIDAALSMWQSFLTSKVSGLGEFEVHVLPLDAIEESTYTNLPSGVNRYLLRAVQMERIWTNQSAFVVAKLARLLVIGFIREPERDRWLGTRIDSCSGIIEPGTIVIPMWLQKWIIEQAVHLTGIDQRVSDRQKQKIRATMELDPDRVLRSDTFEALVRDIELRTRMNE